MPDTRVRLRAITPSKDVINTKQIMGVIKGATVETARGMRTDFQKTTRTWKNKPVFVIQITVDGDAQATVYTDNLIYQFVSGGTRPHMIRPKNAKVLRFGVPFLSKTKVRWLSSRNGKRGNTMIYSKGVMHPGTEPRDFDLEIAAKWLPRYEILMERRINNALEVRE